jgi:hypothetical protein
VLRHGATDGSLLASTRRRGMRRWLVRLALVVAVAVAAYTYLSPLILAGLRKHDSVVAPADKDDGRLLSPDEKASQGVSERSKLFVPPPSRPAQSTRKPIVFAAGLPIGAYGESCEGCDLLHFEEFGVDSSSEGRNILRCSQCEDYNGNPTHSTLDLSKCKKKGQVPEWFIGPAGASHQPVEEWVENNNGRLVCAPRPTGANAVAALRASGREYVAAAVERLDAAQKRTGSVAD